MVTIVKFESINSTSSVGQSEEPKTYKISKGALWKRIGVSKLSLVLNLSKTDPTIEALLLIISDSEFIDLKDPMFLAGLDIMNEKNLLDQMEIDKLKQPAEPSELPGL